MPSAPSRLIEPLEGRELSAPAWLRAGALGPPGAPSAGATPSVPIALGSYVIIRRIGAGGMGVVYEALDPRHGQRVALKTLERMDPSGLYRLKQEFRSVADVTHPNLAALYELVSEGGIWFFTMEFVDGVSFLEYVGAHVVDAEASGAARRAPRPPAGPLGDGAPATARQVGRTVLASARGAEPLPPPSSSDALLTFRSTPRGDPPLTQRSTEPRGARVAVRAARALQRWACAVRAAQADLPEPDASAGQQSAVHPASIDRIRGAMLQLASAVNTLHRAGKVHRDIKPANLLVSHEGRVVVLDFGLVREARADHGEHKVEGTPGYMAPEQAAGGCATPASDWYAVGGVLYHALTGRLPFPGTALDVLTAKQDREPPPPSAIAPGVPPDLDALCVALLRRRPQDRPSGAEILVRLQDVSARKTFPSGEWAAARRVQSDPPASSAAATLLGRDGLLEALFAAQAAVAPAAPVSIQVRGRSGMGKTALVQHFLRALRCDEITPRARAAGGVRRIAPTTVRGRDAAALQRSRWVPSGPLRAASEPLSGRRAAPWGHEGPSRRPAVVLSSRCHERESVPYKAFDSLIDALTHHLSELPEAACAALLPSGIADLVRLFPVLERVRAISKAIEFTAPMTPRPNADARWLGGPEQVRCRASDALKSLLRRIAAEAPLVLAIDDLQWGDHESALLLRELLSPPDPPGLLFIAVYRSDAGGRPPFLRELLADPPFEVRTIEVGPLSPEEAVRLSLARLGWSGAAAEAWAKRIASEAEGSPFFIEELIRYARTVRAAPSRARPLLPPSIASPQSALALAAPTLKEVLAARLTALPPEARRLLEVVAVAGGPIARRVALEAAKVDAGAERALHVLCVGGLLWTSGVHDEDAMDTYHDRIRERVLESMSSDTLAGYYGDLARAQAAEAVLAARTSLR